MEKFMRKFSMFRRQKDAESESGGSTANRPHTDDLRSDDYPFPRITQSKTDSNVDIASSLYGKASYTSHGFVRYTVRDILGKGHYGMVFLAVNESSGVTYAVKVMKKKVRNINKYAYIEEAVLRLSRACSFIVHLYSSFQTKHCYYLVMEYAPGGNLKQVLDTYGVVDMEAARFLTAELVLAIDFLHTNGVIHRDLKIQNILLTIQNHVRLIDFGLSKMGIHGEETTHSGCGTPFYMAPEILRRIAYGNEVDWWALGVVLYKMVTGSFPFMGKTNPEVFVAVTRDRPYYDPRLPADFVSFFKGLLQKHPAKRLGFGKDGAQQVKAHWFFDGIDWDSVQRQETTPPPFAPLRDRTAYKKAKRYYSVKDDKGIITGQPFITESRCQTTRQSQSERARGHVTRRLSGSAPDVPEVLDVQQEAGQGPGGGGKTALSWGPRGLTPEWSGVKTDVVQTITHTSVQTPEDAERRQQELAVKYPYVSREPSETAQGMPAEFVLAE